MRPLLKQLPIACAAFAAALPLNAAPAAAESAQVSVRYEVDIKGVTVMKLRFDAQINGNAYASEVTAGTTGMAKWFSEYKMTMGAQGTLNGGRFQPASFSRERKKNGKRRSATTDWSGGVPVITEENGDDGYASMVGVVNSSTTDPLSLLLGLSFGSGDSPCQGGQRVFDGRDVYDVSVTPGKGGGEGKLSCRIMLNYVAGKEVEDAKPEAAPADVYGMLLRPVESASLGRTIWVPERITGKASGQSFVANSTDMNIN